MHGVVAAQREAFGELASAARELRVYSYPREVAVDRLKLGQRALVRGRGQACGSPRCSKRRAALGVGEDAGGGGVRARP